MAEEFVVTKKVKEGKNGTTITYDFKRASDDNLTISGDVDEVLEDLKKLTSKED